MREDTVQLQRAMDDVLHVLNLRSLQSYYSISPPNSRTSSEAPRDPVRRTSHKESISSQSLPYDHPLHPKMEDVRPRGNGTFMARDREPSQEPPEQDNQSLFSNPMGSVYEVTNLRSLRSGSSKRRYQSDLDTDFISRGLITLQEGQELFDTYAVPWQCIQHTGCLPGNTGFETRLTTTSTALH